MGDKSRHHDEVNITFTKDLIIDGTVTTKLVLSPAELDSLEARFLRIDIFDYVLVNRECRLDDTVNAILSIIQAEHHRVHPRRVSL